MVRATSTLRSLSEPQTGRIQGTAVSLIRWQVSVAHSQLEPHWQDSGDRSQPDPQILADLGDTKSNRAVNPGRPRRHQVQPSCKSWQTSATPSPTELQILALTVRASPKLVRQMSSALTELRINWMSVDIGIAEGNKHNWVPMWPLPQYDSSIGPSRVKSPSNTELASSDLKSELVARHKSNLLVALSVVPPKHEKDHK
ncbi:hypothetical protein L3X38_025372 [Prunus dulcis]|uniref:Uncharacterized protein n=1 Tax=Prunus dulcis TaxID=3755 RepID=A0AAD4W356_PRUDU|nr:hypothetical protein L3X38_025372 [Prunus dulcis]